MDINTNQDASAVEPVQPSSAALEAIARRKTRANTRVRLLTRLLAEAHRELADASAKFSEAKLNQSTIV